MELLGPALDAGAQLLFQTPAPDAIPVVQQTWALVRDIADGLFVVAFCAVGLLVMAAGGHDPRYSVKLLVPRMALAAVMANLSLAACDALVQLENALAAALIGADPGSGLAALAAQVARDTTTVQLAGIVVGLATAVLALSLVALTLARDLLLVLLVCLAPLALAAYAVPQSSDIARAWWRTFTALLFVQVLQAGLVAVGVGLVGSTDWTGSGFALGPALLLAAVLYLLVSLPFTAVRWALRLPTAGSGSLRLAVATLRGSVA